MLLRAQKTERGDSNLDSTPRTALTYRKINGKTVVSFESHNYALLPWRDWQQELGQPLRLISFDFHTDTNDAFQHYAYYFRDKSPFGNRPFQLEDQASRLAQLSPSDTFSVERAVLDLRHDEHIDAAIQSGILDVAFIIGHQTNECVVPAKFAIRQDRIILLGDSNSFCGDEGERRSRDQVIEAEFLSARLAHATEICAATNASGLLSSPLILDIDLDCFNTRQAISPHNPSVFYNLIRQAHAITIARESVCVETCKLDNDLTASWLEERLLDHIAEALS